jgi:hypothetical protein
MVSFRNAMLLDPRFDELREGYEVPIDYVRERCDLR